MKNRSNLDVTSLNIDGTLRVMGAIIGIIGFVLMAGSVGGHETNFLTTKYAIVFGFLGAMLFFVGMTITQGLEQTEEETDFSNLIAWNNTYLSWMMISEFNTTRDWSFVLVSPSGELESEPIGSEDDFYNYFWEELS